MVLEALCRPPFEPTEDISDRYLTLKTTFLLALSSLKRVGDLQALSVAPTHLDFAPGMAKAFLYPRPGYVLKVPSSAPQPIVLQDATICSSVDAELSMSTELPYGEKGTN